MINLETPGKFETLIGQAHQVAVNVFRPNSRKYDTAEHEYPKELDMLAALIDGMTEGGGMAGAGVGTVGGGPSSNGAGGGLGQPQRVQHGEPAGADRAVLGRRRADAVDAAPGSRPGRDRGGRQRGAARALRRQVGGDGDHRARGRLGLGGDPDHRPICDGDEYVLNGSKIFVTSGERAELVVVWATLDRSQGRAAIKSFVVERSNPGLKLERLEHKLGIRASDTANFVLEDCRVPQAEPARQPGDRDPQGLRRGDADVRQHPADGRRDGDRRGPRLPGGDP